MSLEPQFTIILLQKLFHIALPLPQFIQKAIRFEAFERIQAIVCSPLNISWLLLWHIPWSIVQHKLFYFIPSLKFSREFIAAYQYHLTSEDIQDLADF